MKYRNFAVAGLLILAACSSTDGGDGASREAGDLESAVVEDAQEAETAAVGEEATTPPTTVQADETSPVPVTLAEGLPIEDITCGRPLDSFVTCEFWATNNTETNALLTYRGNLLDEAGDILGDFGNSDINVGPGQRVRTTASGIEPEGFQGQTVTVAFNEVEARDQPSPLEGIVVDSMDAGEFEVALSQGLAVEEITCSRNLETFVTCEFWASNTTDSIALLTYRGRLLDENGDILGTFGNSDVDVAPGQRIRTSASGIEPAGYEGQTAVIAFEEVEAR